MKRILLLLIIFTSTSLFSQYVSLDINGNYKIGGTNSQWWQYRYRPVGSSTYTSSAIIQGSSSVLVKLNPFIAYEFSRNFYNFYGQPTSWENPIVFNDNYLNISPKYVGYSYNFDNNDLNEGWRGYRLQNTTTNNYSNIQETNYNGYSVSGESIYMGWASGSGVMLVSPKILDLSTDKKFSFFVYSFQGNYKIEVGTISDPYDPSTFHSLKVENLVGSSGFYKVEVFMNNYNAGDQFIAIKSFGNAGDVYIDDFSYEQSINCFDTTNFEVNNIQQNQAQISFTADSQQNSWELYVKDVTHNTTEIILLDQTNYLLQNLTGVTNYQVKVRANCALGLYSNWSPIINFTTVCENINVGYTTSFLETSYMDPCWKKIQSSVNQAPTSVYDIPAKTGAKYIKMYQGSTTQNNYLITPFIADISNNKRIKFSLVAQGGSDYIENSLTIGTMSNPNDVNTFVPLKTISPLEMNEINGYQVNNYWKEHIIYLENYDISLNHNYIAFRGDLLQYGAVFNIDDFKYENTPICKEPVNLYNDKITQNTAVVKWDSYDNSYGEWEIQYGQTGFTLGNGTIVSSITNPFTILNLVPGTFYDFYVRSKCGNEFSDWSDRGEFKTKCDGFTVGYAEGFETGSFDANTCWTRLTAQVRDTYYSANSQISFSSTKKHSGNKSIRLYHTSTLNQISKKIVVTPRLIDLDNEKIISFWGNLSSNGVSAIQVGTLADPDDYTTFIPYINLTNLTQDQWVKHTVDFSDYYGSDKYIGIRLVNTTSSNDLFYIDDFEYLFNDCTKPSNLSMEQLNADTVLLNWSTNNTYVVDCQIEYGEIGFTPGSGTIINTATIPTTISGLNANTEYQFRVRNNCSSGTINWSNFYDFKVSCLVNSPFYENFDTYPSDANIQFIPDICWTTNEDANNGIYEFVLNEYITNFTSAPNSLRLYNNSLNQDTYITSPYIADFNNNKKLKFWVLGQEYDSVETISIGTIKNPLDLSTYEEYQIINLDNLPLYGKEVYVDFENYTGNNKMFVIKLPKEVLHSLGIVGNIVGIDNIVFADKNNCKEPINVHFTEITDNSALLQWDDTNGSTVEIEYGLQGFSLGSGTILNTDLNQIQINALLESSNYDFYFKTICNLNNSVIVGPIVLTTTCTPFSLPWIEDFNNLPQYGNNILPECFKYIDGNFNLKNTSFSTTVNSSYTYDPDNLMTGYNDTSYIHFFSNYSTEILSPVFNLTAGTTYKFSLQARKSYEYSPMSISMAVGRGQEHHYMDTDLLSVGTMTEYNYRQLDYFFTPLENGIYSFLINPRYSGSVNLIADNFELKEGYTNIINNFEIFDFQNGPNNKLIFENTQNSLLSIVPEINNTSNKVLKMIGSNSGSSFKNEQTNIWTENQRFISKVDFKINHQNFNQLYLNFRLKQTYVTSSEKSRFRVVVNGIILGDEIIPTTNNLDAFETHQYDLTPFLGQNIRISLQHIGESNSGIGDNAYLDDLILSSVLNSEEFNVADLKIYPNPTNDILNIIGRNIDEVSLHNLSGQILFQIKNLEEQKIKIDLSQFENGIYLVKLISNSNNELKTIKVIKN